MIMDKKDVISYFDSHAENWDGELIKNQEIVEKILDNAGVAAGMDILDVATGTGVLIPDYLARKVDSVTAIDISPKMAEICAAKFPEAEVLCGDVEETDFGRLFDCIMVYNAFPHFPEPERLIEKLSSLLKKGGTVTVAHGMSRAKIDSHHHSIEAGKVSVGLMHEDELEKIFEKYLEVTCKISDDRMYQVTGRRI